MSRETPRGRRAALPPPERVARGLRARLNLTAVLAVLLPALTIGALALVRPASVDVSTYPPRETGLNLSILTCPSSLDDTGDVSVASATGLAGQVEVTQSGAASTTEVDVPADRPATADAGSRGLTVRGVDDMAPGLLASRRGPRAGGRVVPRTRLRAVVHRPRRRGAALVGPRARQPRSRPGRRGHQRHRRARPGGRSVVARHHRARRAEPAPRPRPGDPDARRAERPRRGLARPPRCVRRRHLRRAGPRRRRHRLARRPGAGHRPAAARPADREGHPLPGRGQRRRRRGAGRHPGGHQGLRVPARGPRRRDRAARLGRPGSRSARSSARRCGTARSGSRSSPPIPSRPP